MENQNEQAESKPAVTVKPVFSTDMDYKIKIVELSEAEFNACIQWLPNWW
jgi:hypothetical protein